MAESISPVVTEKGLSLQAKTNLGEYGIKFTRMGVGTGTREIDYTNTDEIKKITSLLDERQSVAISSIKIINKTAVRVRGILTNTDLQSGYNISEVGLYAYDPDEGEILYTVILFTRQDYFPSFDGFSTSSVTLTCYTSVSNTDKLTISIAPDAVASAFDMQELYDNFNNHISDLTTHSNPKTRVKETCMLFQKLTNMIISDTGQVHNADEVNAFKSELSRYSNRLRSGINYYTFNDYDDPVFKDIISSLQTYQRTGWAPSVKKTGDAVHDAFADRISRLQSGVLDIGFDYGSQASSFDTFLSNIQAVINGKVDDSFFDFEIEADDPPDESPPSDENPPATVAAQYIEYQNPDIPEVTNIKQAIDAVIESVSVKRV